MKASLCVEKSIINSVFIVFFLVFRGQIIRQLVKTSCAEFQFISISFN